MNEDDKSIQAKVLMLQLTKAVFWGMDLNKLDYIRNKNTIIERIIEAGLENDEIIMWKLYSYEDIKNVALNMENLDEEKVIYTAFVLEVDEKEFKCY